MSRKTVKSMKNVTSEWIPARSWSGWYKGKNSKTPPGIPRIADSTVQANSVATLYKETET
jgi:hypothetical protein